MTEGIDVDRMAAQAGRMGTFEPDFQGPDEAERVPVVVVVVSGGAVAEIGVAGGVVQAIVLDYDNDEAGDPFAEGYTEDTTDLSDWPLVASGGGGGALRIWSALPGWLKAHIEANNRPK